MKSVEVILNTELRGGMKPWFDDFLSVIFERWAPDFRPRLLNSSIQAYVDWIHGSHSGEAICRAIRKSEITTRTYITVVLEPDCLHLRDRALDVGADSYIVRMPDRNAIIEGLLTRMLGDVEAPNRALTSGKLVVDEDRAKALFDGQHISMWPNELNLLRHFMKNRGKVFSRAQLVAALGKDDKTVDEKTIYRTISRLRIALRSVEAGEVIRTVRPLGYIMDE